MSLRTSRRTTSSPSTRAGDLPVEWRSRVEAAANRGATDASQRAGVIVLVLVLLVLPQAAYAQRDQFFDTLLPFYRALTGVYGDEGTQLTEYLQTLSAALARWDRALVVTDLDVRTRLKNADPQTALEVH